MLSKKTDDIEVEISGGGGKAIIEGKTTVSFKTFVSLVLQRKITDLFKSRGKDPVIINSELLTELASSPQDSHENKAQLVLVTMGAGVIVGVFCFTVLQVILQEFFSFPLYTRELLLIAGSLLGLAIIGIVLSKVKKRNKGEKLLETMEKLAALISKK